MKKRIISVLLLTVVLGVWLFMGVFQHREYGTYNLFLKNRPSLRFYFYSPIGESDRTIESFSPWTQRSERAYIDLVEKKGGFERILWSW